MTFYFNQQKENFLVFLFPICGNIPRSMCCLFLIEMKIKYKVHISHFSELEIKK